MLFSSAFIYVDGVSCFSLLFQAHGYVARSAYKLLEVQEKYKIISPGIAKNYHVFGQFISLFCFARSDIVYLYEYDLNSLTLSLSMLSARAAGSTVLDLGCSPGAWLQVACQSLGPWDVGGLVLGIDLKVRKFRLCDCGPFFFWILLTCNHFPAFSCKPKSLH